MTRRLFPSEFVNVRLLVDTLQNAVLVPTPAVQSGAPGEYVYLVNADQSVSVHKVTPGPERRQEYRHPVGPDGRSNGGHGRYGPPERRRQNKNRRGETGRSRRRGCARRAGARRTTAGQRITRQDSRFAGLLSDVRRAG